MRTKRSPGRSVLLPTLAMLLLNASPCLAQSISGRVTDSAGVAIPNVRVLMRPAGDTSTASLRTAYTDERGDYHISLGMRGQFMLSASRTGFRLELERTVDVSTGEARVDLVMGALPVMLGTVDVSARADLSCLRLDSPRQSPRVREAVLHVQELIRARRTIEREYIYQVHDVLSGRDSRGIMLYRERDFVQRPGDSVLIGEFPWKPGDPSGPLAGPMGLSNGGNSWAFPNEDTILVPEFTTIWMCFDTTLVRAGRGAYEVRFRQVWGASPEKSGALRIAEDGMLTEFSIQYGRPGHLEGKIVYTRIDLHGASFPFIAQAVSSMGSERRFKYSAFIRAK